MSFKYIITETERERLPNGHYDAELIEIEEKVSHYLGEMYSFVEVTWELFEKGYEGRIETEIFKIGQSDLKKAKIERWRLSILCKQIGQLNTGDEIERAQLVGKKARLFVENKISERDGKTYQNIVNRILLPTQPENNSKDDYDPEKAAAILKLAGIQLPDKAVPSSQPLNDDVPW